MQEDIQSTYELLLKGLNHVRIKNGPRRTVFERGQEQEQVQEQEQEQVQEQLRRKSDDVSNNREPSDYAENVKQQPRGGAVLPVTWGSRASGQYQRQTRKAVGQILARSQQRRVIRVCATVGVLPPRNIVRRRMCVKRLSTTA